MMAIGYEVFTTASTITITKKEYLNIEKITHTDPKYYIESKGLWIAGYNN